MQVGHPLAAGLEQLLGGQGRATAGMADHHQRAIGGQLAGAAFELRQGDQQAAGHSSIGSVEFLGGAYVEQRDLALMGHHPGGVEFGQAGIAAGQGCPGRC